MTTGIDEALIQWWGATDSLTELVPIENVSIETEQVDEDSEDDETTEDQDDDGLFDDYVVIKVRTEKHWQTNSGTGYRSTVDVQCNSFDYESVAGLSSQVESSWHRGSYSASGSEIALSLFVDAECSQDETTGVWTKTVKFQMNHASI